LKSHGFFIAILFFIEAFSFIIFSCKATFIFTLVFNQFIRVATLLDKVAGSSRLFVGRSLILSFLFIRRIILVKHLLGLN